MSSTRLVTIGDRKVQLTTGGDGPPLVYLHSAAGEAEWLGFHEALAAHFTLHVPAHPGFGQSTGLDQVRDIHDMAWNYVDLFQQMGWEGVPVVGFSLGAWLAMEMALLRPSLIERMVLVAPAGVRLRELPFGEIFVDDFDRLRSLLFADPHHPSANDILPSSFTDPRILQWLRAGSATARVAWNPYLHDPRLPRHLHRLTMPTLLMWGDEDRVIPADYGTYYEERLPNARLVRLPGTGHMLPLEATETFVQHVTQFCMPQGR